MSIILVVFAFVATILERTEAADHTVGDSTGWTSSAGAKFYSDWASNNTFKENDVLGEFLFYLLKILIWLNQIVSYPNAAITLQFSISLRVRTLLLQLTRQTLTTAMWIKIQMT